MRFLLTHLVYFDMYRKKKKHNRIVYPMSKCIYENNYLFSSQEATICPRSSGPFYVVTYSVTTSWTHSTSLQPITLEQHFFTHPCPLATIITRYTITTTVRQSITFQTGTGIFIWICMPKQQSNGSHTYFNLSYDQITNILMH